MLPPARPSLAGLGRAIPGLLSAAHSLPEGCIRGPECKIRACGTEQLNIARGARNIDAGCF